LDDVFPAREWNERNAYMKFEVITLYNSSETEYRGDS
jgi:hypothetical protein